MMQVLRLMNRFCGAVGSLALAFVFAGLAGTSDVGARPSAVSFSVTLQATVTKDWNTVTETTEEGCAVSHRWSGKRRIVLRSVTPTNVVVTLKHGRASFRPSAVRFVRVDVKTTGALLTHIKAPCVEKIETKRCAAYRHVARGATLRFFRSRSNEISFHPARLPVEMRACPRESTAVRSIRPGLRDAQGTFSELGLSRGASQTAFGSAEVTTELEGAATGRVVERVSWSLTFTRR